MNPISCSTTGILSKNSSQTQEKSAIVEIESIPSRGGKRKQADISVSTTVDKFIHQSKDDLAYHQNLPARIVTAQNLVGNFTETHLQPSKINKDFPENAFLPPNFEQLPKVITMMSTAGHNTYKNTGEDNDKIKDQLSCYIQKRNIHKKYLDTLTYIIASENKELKDIPLEDLKNMLRALNFADVSTQDKYFNEYNIKIIKTGAVFFTWTAMNRTSIFNGKNHRSKINYVKHIIETAKQLEKSTHPVLVVYSTSDMPDTCILEMETYFSNQPNIITLCAERDFDFVLSGIENNIHKNDHLRLEVLNAQDRVMKKAQKKAIQLSKDPLANALYICESSSLVYSDMDNHFINHFPDYLIAFDGAVCAPILNTIPTDEDHLGLRLLGELGHENIKLNCESIKIDEEKELLTLITNLQVYATQQNQLKHQPADIRIRNLSMKLSELAAETKKHKANQVIESIKEHSLQNELDTTTDNASDYSSQKRGLFRSDNGFIMCSSQNNKKLKKVFNKSCNTHCAMIAFHHYEDGKKECYSGSSVLYNPHHKKANSLVGYQLIDSIIIGHDGTWSGDCCMVDIHSSINGKEIKTRINFSHSIIMFELIGDSQQKILDIDLSDATNS